MINIPNYIEDTDGKTLEVYIHDGTPVVKQTCSRCGGSGNYSFNLQDGTRCYGCNGGGIQYIKATTVINRVKLADRMDRQRNINCGLTNYEVKVMRAWAETRAAEKAAYCGLSLRDVEIMINWSKDRVADKARAAKQAQADSLDHIGEIKQRLELTLIVDKIIPIDGPYGTTLMHIMYDTAGNKVIWFCSGSPLEITGKAVTVMATIKFHETRLYRGIHEKSTQVLRVKEVK